MQRLAISAAAILAFASVTVCRAGDVRVAVDGGRLYIESVEPRSDDVILIAYATIHRDFLRITNLNGTIYGRPEVLVLAPHDLTVDLGDGNDTLRIQSNISFRHVSIDVGASQSSSNDDDLVEMTLNYQGTLWIGTGPRNDDVTLLGVHCNRWSSLFKALSINTGDGSDDVTILDSFFVAEYAFITTYASGNSGDLSVDRVVMDAAGVDYLWINQGAGADTATLRDMDLKSLSMNTGGGDDDAAISFCHCDSLTANLGAGDDSLLLFETTAGSTLAYGGAGLDRLNRIGFSSTSVRVYDWEYFNGRPAAIYAPNLPSTSTTFSTR